jgi:hypothetical protein
MKYTTLTSTIAIALSTVAHAQSQRPSASEVFALRTECAQRGEAVFEKRLAEIFGDERIGIATHSFGTHYDPKTNRCYVQVIDEYEGGLSGYIQLIDGQTEEQLAYCRAVNGEWHGMIGATNFEEVVPDFIGYDNAWRYIAAKMMDDRKQFASSLE